ncbi:mechanosensitive ion channel family protein [Piscinibacter koreensis]|uniref:Mechanosensitive ion channel family protein n=1 Tax=Piscinibacter koreensis TaxID=2742824 RepID=A0A7Y6NNI6_9BURK|nr:mechanosensitive ion channel family protein [Schlegelella koreensis]NUZ06478.1 mechanosensitive ion channel family protein [Schlegelella koreensis]
MEWTDNWVLAPWGRLALLAVVAIVGATVAHRVLRPIAMRVGRYSTVLAAVFRRIDQPVQFILPLLALLVLWQGVPGDVAGISAVEHTTAVLTILAVTWLASASVHGVAEAVITSHPLDLADNLEARRIQTQTRVLARIAHTTVIVAGLAFVLMTFPKARQVGTSLLASAGVAGLVLGIAARPVFGNLVAGLQIALAQPIRIDDVLIIEGEWGRVEEITATYVVLKIWDERRLIIPLQWFIEHPFQNWTRRGAELLGTVFLWVDYTLPVEPIRTEARRLCEGASEWDGRVCVVQVTDTSEKSMQLRILVSAASSSLAFDLRCKVREGLIDFIQREHPAALPRARTDVESARGATPGALSAWAAAER